jgi:intracellular septation protein
MLGILNIWVIYNFDTDTWVDFKFYGITGITLGFAVLQAFYMARYLKTVPVINETSVHKE